MGCVCVCVEGGGEDYSMAKLHGKTMLLAKKRIECDLLKHGFAWGIFYMSFFFPYLNPVHST